MASKGAAMTDHHINRDGISIFARTAGVDHPIAPTVVFANSLGTTLHLWDKVLPLLPDGLRLVRFDTRGHGKSDVPDAPYAMGALISDAEAVCDALKVRNCVFVGLSLGGMVAQGLAVKRLDIVRALVLSNTGAKIGTAQMWADRIAALRAGGLAPMMDEIMARWFTADFRASPDCAPWRNMCAETPLEGYIGCCAAIAGADFITPTSGLRLSALGIAGSDDKATPADLVRETVDLIPGSTFRILRRTGHLPCVEDPIAYAETLTEFLQGIGHI
jgi:3-oxoadipate enol-lactonase